MKILKALLVFSLLCFAALLVLVLRPVPKTSLDECLTINGKVISVYEAGTKDIAFRLNSDDRIFYINRGAENGLQVEQLKNQLMHEEVTILYPDYWTPIDHEGSVRHLSQIALGSEIIYSEF